MRKVFLVSVAALFALCATKASVTADDSAEQAAKAAQAFRSQSEAVAPAPDGTIFCEAEEFKVEKPGWQAQPWGKNYYAATFANTFLSRKAFLGAPAKTDEDAVATITIDVKEAGKYLVLARYEAAYRFETQFKLKVEQAGQVKFDRLYGARANPKIWAFANKIKNEVAWPWGAVENVVWEGHDAYVDLQPGLVKLTLTAGKQPDNGAKRNVDVVMLTRDEAQVKTRIEKEAYLPLDGWLAQAGDVWMKINNTGAGKATVTVGTMQEHSPYWIHMRNWKPVVVEVEPGKRTDWIEIGSLMDTLNDGLWGVETSAPCEIEYGVRNAKGAIESIRSFNVNGKLALVSQADMRYSRKLVTPDEATKELFDYLKSLPVQGKKIELTRVDGAGALPKEFYDFYGLNLSLNGAGKLLDCREHSDAQLSEVYGKMSEPERKSVLIMSLGDEIGLPQPDPKAATEGFVAFLKSHGANAQEVDPTAGGDWAKIAFSTEEKNKSEKPGLYYWSHRYLHDYGIQAIKKRTDILRPLFPNAHIGANFSPHHGGAEHSYLGEVFSWVTCFRDDGMTLPWSEDYIWQVPVGTPQMNGINLDLFRAGLRGKPNRKIMYYVMPHFPGNTPAMWRRLFHNAVGHGAKMLNLFEFDPIWVAYSENHVTGKEMYASVLRCLRELGSYEDIVQSGTVRPARTALWFSETADIWHDNAHSFGEAKRALYVAILNQQLPLDFLVEQDAANGTLGQYDVLYLTDNHVSRAASAKIADWVKNGGRLFATAGAGMFDELNQPNKMLGELLGVNQTELLTPADQQVGFIKQDLNFVQPLSEVTLQASKFLVFGVVSKIQPAAGTKVEGVFTDKSPAIVANTVGKGQTVYCAFLPSLSFFKPAVPLRPVDRGSSDDAMSHFLPTDFDRNVGKLIGTVAKDVVRPVTFDAESVEASVIESPAGVAIVVNNWSGQPRKDLKLTVNVSVPAKSVALASGGKIQMTKEGDKTLLTFDLDLADTIILR